MNEGKPQMTKDRKQIVPQSSESKNYAIMELDGESLRRIIEINLGGEHSLTEFDLIRARVPSGGGVAFNIEGPEGTTSANELCGVIVAHQTRRAYWERSYDDGEGENGPPDCWSPDGINGYGTEAEKCGGLCARCPMSRFGSAIRDGKPSRGQRCAQRRAIFIVPHDSILPIYLSLPPTSLGAFKSYLAGLIGRKLPITGVETRITLIQASSGGGRRYSEARFAIAHVLDQDTAARFTEFGRMFSAMFRPTIPEEEKN